MYSSGKAGGTSILRPVGTYFEISYGGRYLVMDMLKNVVLSTANKWDGEIVELRKCSVWVTLSIMV